MLKKNEHRFNLIEFYTYHEINMSLDLVKALAFSAEL